MVELILEFVCEPLFHLAIYVPGMCISAITGRSRHEIADGPIIAISIAFWAVVFVLGLACWGAVSWLY